MNDCLPVRPARIMRRLIRPVKRPCENSCHGHTAPDRALVHPSFLASVRQWEHGAQEGVRRHGGGRRNRHVSVACGVAGRLSVTGRWPRENWSDARRLRSDYISTGWTYPPGKPRGASCPDGDETGAYLTALRRRAADVLGSRPLRTLTDVELNAIIFTQVFQAFAIHRASMEKILLPCRVLDKPEPLVHSQRSNRSGHRAPFGVLEIAH